MKFSANRLSAEFRGANYFSQPKTKTFHPIRSHWFLDRYLDVIWLVSPFLAHLVCIQAVPVRLANSVNRSSHLHEEVIHDIYSSADATAGALMNDGRVHCNQNVWGVPVH